MDIGYITIRYDHEAVATTGISDLTACWCNGVKTDLEMLQELGAKTLDSLLEEYEIDLFCVMGGGN